MSSPQGVPAPRDRAPDPLAHDWLSICRRVVRAQRTLFDDASGIAARTEYEGVGEGGDWALALDRSCEQAVFDELDDLAAIGASFTAISEERGEVGFGAAGAAVRVVIDPIDGSMNARRTIPSHCLSLAVASGASMADVEFGYVYDFGAGEEFAAVRGGGATLDGEPIVAFEGAAVLEVVGLEAAKPELTVPVVRELEGKVYRLRVLGSIAISLCYVANGRFDGMLSLRQARSVDAAAGQLIAREAGAEVAFGPQGFDGADLGLEQRYPVAAARDRERLDLLLEAQSANPGEG
jgi:myo-inositol-1(or 4)-monophosphatase